MKQTTRVNRGRLPRIEKPCECCGATMSLKVESQNQRFCSRECFRKWAVEQGGLRKFDYAEVVRRYRSGEKITTIMADLGISRWNIYLILNSEGIKTDRPKRRVTGTGACPNCGKTFEGSPSRIARRKFCSWACSVLGQDRPEQERPDADEIAERYRRGERIRAIADIHGAKIPTIYRILRRRGIKPDRGGGRYPRQKKREAA